MDTKQQVHTLLPVLLWICIFLIPAPTPVLAAQLGATADDRSTPAARDSEVILAYSSHSHLLALWRMAINGPQTDADWEALHSVLWDDDWRVRWLALHAVSGSCQAQASSQMEGQPHTAINRIAGDIASQLYCDETAIRREAASILLELGPEGLGFSNFPRGYHGLVEHLDDPDQQVADTLAELLARWLSQADPAERNTITMSLLHIMAETDRSSYFAALHTLRDEHDPQLADALTLLDASEARRIVQREMVQRVFQLAAPAVVEPLSAQLADLDGAEREQAANALAVLGKQAVPALPQLAHALFDGDVQLARRAFFAIEATGQAGVGAAPELARLVQSDRANLADDATRRLAYFGGAVGVDAVMALLKRSADPTSCGTALEAVKAIAPAAYEEYASMAFAAADEARQAAEPGPAVRAWRKIVSSSTFRRKVARLLKQQPGKPAWRELDDNSTSGEIAAFLDDLLDNRYCDCSRLKYAIKDWAQVPPAVQRNLWSRYTACQLIPGWMEIPPPQYRELAELASLLAASDPEAVSVFSALTTNGSQRRLGLYGLTYCGGKAKELAPQLRAMLASSQAAPDERALCARVLRTAGCAGADPALLIRLASAAFIESYHIDAAEIQAYGYDSHGYSLDEASIMLRQAYSLLTAELGAALGDCGPVAKPMLLALAQEKFDPSQSPVHTYDPRRDAAVVQLRRAAMAALGETGPAMQAGQAAGGVAYPGIPASLPLEVAIAMKWLQGTGRLGSFSHNPARLDAELQDRVAAAQTLGQLGCTDDTVVLALLEAAQDDTAAPLPAEVDPNDWRAKLAQPVMPLREAAIVALARLASSRRSIDPALPVPTEHPHPNL